MNEYRKYLVIPKSNGENNNISHENTQEHSQEHQKFSCHLFILFPSIIVWKERKEEPPALDVTLPKEIGVGLVGSYQSVLGLLLADLAMPASLQNTRHSYLGENFIKSCKFCDY